MSQGQKYQTVKVKLRLKEEDYEYINTSFSQAGINWDSFCLGALLKTFLDATKEYQESVRDIQQVMETTNELPVGLRGTGDGGTAVTQSEG